MTKKMTKSKIALLGLEGRLIFFSMQEEKLIVPEVVLPDFFPPTLLRVMAFTGHVCVSHMNLVFSIWLRP